MGPRRGAVAVLPRAPAHSFGHGPPRFPSSLYEVRPEPGTYFAQRPMQRPAGWGVSSQSRSAPAASIATKLPPGFASALPGPGDFSPRDALLRSSSPCFTFKGVAAKDRLAKNPAPGQYNPREGLSHPHAPAVSISHRLPESKEAERRPPVGEYDPTAWRPKSPLPVTNKHKRGAEARDRADSGHAVPGPGQYKLPASRGPAMTIGARLRSARQAGGGAHSYDSGESTLGAAALA